MKPNSLWGADSCSGRQEIHNYLRNPTVHDHVYKGWPLERWIGHKLTNVMKENLSWEAESGLQVKYMKLFGNRKSITCSQEHATGPYLESISHTINEKQNLEKQRDSHWLKFPTSVHLEETSVRTV
jgi:hypothetical protein